MTHVFNRMLRIGASAAALLLSLGVFALADDVAAKPEAKKPADAAAKDKDKVAAAKPKPTLSPEMTTLRDAVRQVLTAQHKQAFNTRQNSATEVMSVCRAFGCVAEVSQEGADGKRINAITCLCWNYPCAGAELLGYSGKRIAPRIGYGRQEHPGEFLAVLAMARVPDEYPVRIGADVRKVADLVEAEKLGCREGGDSSLKLLGLAYYVDEPQWKNDLGETWSIERMIEEEMEQPIVSAPEGGLNRLMALGYAVERREKRKQPLDGEFQRAKKYVKDYQEYALSLQNSDGTWGPYYLAARSAGADASSQLQATGRILEFLALTLPDEKLSDHRVVAAVESVARLLGGQQYQGNAPSLSTREIVSLGHALHALVVYDQRAFHPFDSADAAK